MDTQPAKQVGGKDVQSICTCASMYQQHTIKGKRYIRMEE